jgi:hypothetical protein
VEFEATADPSCATARIENENASKRTAKRRSTSNDPLTINLKKTPTRELEHAGAQKEGEKK